MAPPGGHVKRKKSQKFEVNLSDFVVHITKANANEFL